MASIPRVFTIPASAPFLPTLIRNWLDGKLVSGFPDTSDPLALANATLFLPTRRACRLAREQFLDVLGCDAAVLPRIIAIGDIDEDELIFADAAGFIAETALDLPPTLGALERRILLARLVLQWARSPELHGSSGAMLVAQSPVAALTLADDLARLIDDMTTRQVPWQHLDDLVPEHLDKYWQLSLRFLKIARDTWPAILAGRGVIEPAERRDRLIAAEAARLAIQPRGPIIAAGSTGSMPATAALLTAITKLPHGAVVLPGLDMDLDNESWTLIGGFSKSTAGTAPPLAGHPQFAMHALLTRIGIDRSMVTSLAAPASHGRERVVSEALRPAAATERWKDRLDDGTITRAIAGVTIIEADNVEEEALAIAIALRETIEDEGKVAALVTPDRVLARRVIATLERWRITADDSGGDALTDTKAGLFARLIAETIIGGFAPATLLGLLKHPLFRLGGDEDAHHNAITLLERAVLRGPRPRPGTAGLARALATLREQQSALHPRDARAGIDDLNATAEFVAQLTSAFAPLEMLGGKPHAFSEIAARHHEVIVFLGANAAGKAPVFAGEDGEALAGAFDDLSGRATQDDLIIDPQDYPDLFRTAIEGRVVRKPAIPGARVRVFGLLEARLQNVDRMVLGGLVETSWPPDAHTDPWLNRPMRQALGLDSPERRIGLSAHDFAQALGTPEVVLSYATKLAGTPSVVSRFVQRLAAITGEQPWNDARMRGAKYLAYARELDRPQQAPRPVEAPQPCPPRSARPTRLSVTDVEHWLRDPYTIYAKHVLRLIPLDPVDMPLGARHRGTAFHEAIGEFTQAFAERLPPDAVPALIRLGEQQFKSLEDYPEARAFWWPRFLRIARWFVDWEGSRRENLAAIYAEIRGKIEIPLGERTFKLVARADRIERLNDGRYAILDYKTGQTRTEKQVSTGLAPQLPLEAAILRQGGFPGIPAQASVAELLYVALKGGEPAGEAMTIKFTEGTPDSQADLAHAKFAAMAARFEDESMPFRSLVHPMWTTHYGEYDHLARVKEWSATGGTSDGDAQ